LQVDFALIAEPVDTVDGTRRTDVATHNTIFRPR